MPDSPTEFVLYESDSGVATLTLIRADGLLREHYSAQHSSETVLEARKKSRPQIGFSKSC